MYIQVHTKHILVYTGIYNVRTELARKWMFLHLKQQDVLCCTWEVYTSMYRPKINAPRVKNHQLFDTVQVYAMF